MRIRISDRLRQTAGSLMVVLGLLLATAAVATDLNPRLVGSFKTSEGWGQGDAVSVALSGSVAYVSTYGRGLQILDISNPAVPTKLGSYSPASNWKIVWRVAVANDYAYLCDEEVGLVVLEVTDPAAPRRVGGYKPTGPGSKIATAYDVFLSGNYAYVAAGQGGLVVLDVSNPASPRRVGGLGLPGEVHGVVVSGNFAYLADRFLDESSTSPGALRIMDISDPTNPRSVANFPVDGQAWSLAVSGGVAYVATIGALELIDVTDPANPLHIARHRPSGFSVISDHRAITSSLEVLDISNPAMPRRLGGYPGGRLDSGSVIVVDNYAYLAAAEGLQIIDLEPEANLSRIGSLDTSGRAYGVTVSGTNAYIADGDWGLQIIDISDPTQPARLGDYPTTAVLVAMSGNHVCVLGSPSMEIFDTSNPASPQWVSSYDILGWVPGKAMATSGDYAFLGVSEYPSARVEIIDLRTPSSPQAVGVYDTGDLYPLAAAAYGNYLLVAGYDGGSGLRVLDVGNPANPQLVGSYTNIGSKDISCIAVAGNHAYAVSLSAGFLVLDLSDTSQPKLLGNLQDPGLVWNQGWRRLAVSDGFAYGAAGLQGVQVIDVRDPTHPRHVGGNSVVVANDLAISGNHLFVAGDDQGLQVFDLALSLLEPAPTLSVAQSGARIEISWPAATSGMVLETMNELAPTSSWNTEPTAPALVGERNVVSLEVGSGPKFFRLRKP